jgi:hypothetical protein
LSIDDRTQSQRPTLRNQIERGDRENNFAFQGAVSAQPDPADEIKSAADKIHDDLLFVLPLIAAKRRRRREYGLLSAQYTQAFDRKWIHGERPAEEPMLGSGDRQSLADLATGYEIVQETRPVPFNVRMLIQLAINTALPLLPLGFTILPFRSLITQAIKIVL